MERLEFTAAPGDTGRLDAWLAGQCPTLSRSALQGLMEQGLVTRNGAPVNKKEKVLPGAVYTIDLLDPQPIEAVPQNIPLDIVYEDDDLLVVNKPKGMVVHPAPGNPDGTLVNALLYHCAGQLSGIGGAIRPGIVHRIDKDTSGLLVVAKNDAAHHALSEQMSVHSIHRVYHAVVYGNLKEDEGYVEAWLGRDPRGVTGWRLSRFLSLADALEHYRSLPDSGVKAFGLTDGVHVLELVRHIPPQDEKAGMDVLASDYRAFPLWREVRAAAEAASACVSVLHIHDRPVPMAAYPR